MAYDLASRQGKIPAIQRKRETRLPSFGEKLKQEREKRKITLEEISTSTKIGTRMLQALEEDKFNQLPGGIFNKGFVRAYARCLSLDEEQTVADYLQASGDAPPLPTEIVSREDPAREPVATVSRLEAISDNQSRPLPWGWFAAILLVVALALSFWSHRRREHTKLPGRSSPAAAATSQSSSPTTPVGEQSAVARAVVPEGKATPMAAALQGGFLQEPVANAATPGEFAVVIRAHEESWVSITADGKSHSSELLVGGSERTIRGRKEVVVKVGNAGGVDLWFNGKKLSGGGEFGEVRTLTFGPGGLIANAPPPASTP
jgi:cytoskeleton protein RodZ